jgi:transposase
VRQDLSPRVPIDPFTQLLGFVRVRRVGLEVFLANPDVPIDTNHLERALRVISMGRKNWNCYWTELGAQHAGIMLASRVADLTPRLWKQRFAAARLRSAHPRRVGQTPQIIAY